MFILRNSFLAAALTASLFLAAAHSIAQSTPAPAAKPAQSIPTQSISEKIARIEESARHQHRNRGPAKGPARHGRRVRPPHHRRPPLHRQETVDHPRHPSQSAYEKIKLQIIAHRPKS